MPQTSRGRSQDRKRVAGGQDYEVRYEAKKTGASKKRVKKAIGRQQPPKGRKRTGLTIGSEAIPAAKASGQSRQNPQDRYLQHQQYP